jgi:hypothetical protein
MDGLSAAASVAGVLSLAFQLFGGCIQGFVLLSTARNLRRDAATIVCMLDLQEIHLTHWARQAGLLSGAGALDPRLNAPVVESTLRKLRDLLLDSDRLRRRYGLQLDLVDPAINATLQANSNREAKGEEEEEEDAAEGEKFRVLTGVSQEVRTKILAKIGAEPGTKNVLKRLRWAVDKDKSKELVVDVQGLVRELWYLIEPWQFDNIKEISSNVVAMNGKFEQLMILAEAFGQQQQQQQQQQRQEHRTKTSLGTIAEVKALRVGLDSDRIQSQPSRPNLLAKLEPLKQTKLRNFRPLRKSPAMGLADYDGQEVFVERKLLNPSTRRKILPRAQNLAALLNLPKEETFRSLQCRGLIEDELDVSFVFHLPDPESPAQPRSLLDLFHARNGIEPPSLTDRIQLAVSLARAVQDFHRAGWFHKSLRSENILFFPAHEASSSVPRELLASPYLAGFEFSRLDGASELSEQPFSDPARDIYRHPSALGAPTESFSALMDIYSLGCVLFEIAEWRALKYLVETAVKVDDEQVPHDAITGVRDFLTAGEGKGRIGNARLKTKMGDIYFETVLLCLKGELPEAGSDRIEEGMFRPGLLWTVLKKLESCNV